MQSDRTRTLDIGRPLALVPAVMLVLGGWLHRWNAEDAFIDFRVVENILAGHGPVLNVGERVEAITNPLWAWAIAACAGLADLLGAEGAPIEWSATALGLVLSGVGLWLLARAAAHTWRTAGTDATLLPLGVLVYAALPPAWDFVTSGLETSLFVAWLGSSTYLLARGARGGDGAGPWRLGAGLAIGLGPLIRPDLALVAGPLFLVAVYQELAVPTREGRGLGGQIRHVALLGLCSWTVPIAYQIFRMGFYACLVPNTALAKEAGLASWLHGIHYLLDLVTAYHLWLPAAVLVALVAKPLRAVLDGGERGHAILTVALLLGGGLHGLFIVRAGGDFMHARLLLPSLLTLLAAVAAVPISGQRSARLGALLITAWAVTCAGMLRPDYHADAVGPAWEACTSEAGLTDERCFFLRSSKEDHPITHRDYRRHIWTQDGYSLRTISASWSGLLYTKQPAYDLVVFGKELPSTELAAWVPQPTAALRCNIGLAGLTAGPDVHLIDCRGLGEPIAARLVLDTSIRPEEVTPYQEAPISPGVEAVLNHLPGGSTLLSGMQEAWSERSRPGHEKELPAAWVMARYSTTQEGESAEVAAARRSLGCGELALLHEAITQPLTARRFMDNMLLSFRLTRLRIPADPNRAATELCPDRAG